MILARLGYSGKGIWVEPVLSKEGAAVE